ncbi:hypothetical protein [Actinophytocola sp.]|uniref:hypothetical protein n=1 Tax=Actinophytocola sp. TaxID=1872138 RepID=UPI002D7E9486|nr:hypothetical protein [Actinophytocola sp.]HET9141402.1 hypothetical protein [Actinophytocola sp.]
MSIVVMHRVTDTRAGAPHNLAVARRAGRRRRQRPDPAGRRPANRNRRSAPK